VNGGSILSLGRNDKGVIRHSSWSKIATPGCGWRWISQGWRSRVVSRIDSIVNIIPRIAYTGANENRCWVQHSIKVGFILPILKDCGFYVIFNPPAIFSLKKMVAPPPKPAA
jgi:hypothetical protein